MFKYFKTLMKGRLFIIMLFASARLLASDPLLQEFMKDVEIVIGDEKERSVFDEFEDE